MMKNKPRRSRHTHWDESAEETHVVASVSRSTQTDAIDCGQQRIEELVLGFFFFLEKFDKLLHQTPVVPASSVAPTEFLTDGHCV